MKTASPLLAGITLAVIVAACTGSGALPTPTDPPGSVPPSTQPTVPPSVEPSPGLGSPEDAAARVIASDARFAGILQQDRNMIGQGSWWTSKASDQGYRVQVEIGWGDCPAGCISRHQWSFDVATDGTITLVEETGDPLPASDY